MRSRLVAAATLLLLSGCSLLEGIDSAVTLTVHNESDAAIQLEIIEAPDSAAGRPRTIAPPIGIEPGEHQVRVAPPMDRWAVRLQGADGFIYSDDLERRQPQLQDGTDFILVNVEGHLEGLVSGRP